MKVFVAKHGGTCPSEKQHPDFLVLAEGCRHAKQIAENYLISIDCEYWLQAHIVDATVNDVQAILGGDLPVILSSSRLANAVARLSKDHLPATKGQTRTTTTQE